MNRGLFGFDGVSGGLRLYLSPPVRVSKYTTGARYSIAHPFPRRPSFARCLLTCRIAEGSYAVGDQTLYTPTDSTSVTGVGIIYRPDDIVFLLAVGNGFSLKNPVSSNSFAITPANWDLAFLVGGS
jgi:hypothetical protein